MNSISKLIKQYAIHAFIIILISASAILGSAYIFQYGFGYAPCELCYYQRYPYMAVMAISLLGIFAQNGGVKIAKPVIIALLLLCGLLLFTDAIIAGYHAGVEYKWWLGPTSCTSSVTLAGTVEQRLAQIMGAPIIMCDQAAWTLFGISMAGYNFFLASFLGIFAIMSWSNLKKQ